MKWQSIDRQSDEMKFQKLRFPTCNQPKLELPQFKCYNAKKKTDAVWKCLSIANGTYTTILYVFSSVFLANAPWRCQTLSISKHFVHLIFIHTYLMHAIVHRLTYFPPTIAFTYIGVLVCEWRMCTKRKALSHAKLIWCEHFYSINSNAFDFLALKACSACIQFRFGYMMMTVKRTMTTPLLPSSKYSTTNFWEWSDRKTKRNRTREWTKNVAFING